MPADMNRALEEDNVLVDFSNGERPGFHKVSTNTNIVRKSAEVLGKAMDTISSMSRLVTAKIDSMPVKPAQVEVSFCIVLSAEAGALISKVGTGTEINVTLLFEHR